MAKKQIEYSSLSEEEKKELLKIARVTIANLAIGRKLDLPEIKYPVFNEKRGAFVTLRKQGELRGCIGYIDAIKSLLETIVEMAEAAAFQDPRFRPVRVEELPLLDIEISVLSPLQLVTNVEDIQVGIHGLMIERGYYSGLLLPQVATEHQWQRTTFLQHTCLKAGLPLDAWQDPETKIYFFSAVIFGESGAEEWVA